MTDTQASLTFANRGRLVKDRGSGELKITCRNWECGVVLPADSYRDEDSPDTWRIFERIIPVPMELPGEPLANDGLQRPWFGQERR